MRLPSVVCQNGFYIIDSRFQNFHTYLVFIIVVIIKMLTTMSWIETFQALALTVVSIGVAVATVTDLQFHFFGACVALAWIVPSAVNKILWSRLQQQENWTALAWVICLFILLAIYIPIFLSPCLICGLINRLMWKTTPITLIFLAAMLPCLDPPGVLSFDWNFINTLVILTSAILGFLLQWSGALALG